jgi:hypothetical protein
LILRGPHMTDRVLYRNRADARIGDVVIVDGYP